MNNKENDQRRTEEIIKNKIQSFEEVIYYNLNVERIDVTQNIQSINNRVWEVDRVIVATYHVVEYNSTVFGDKIQGCINENQSSAIKVEVQYSMTVDKRNNNVYSAFCIARKM